MIAAPSRPVLRYHGGKWKLAPWIIGHFPEHRVYVEPFAGAASVLMRKPRSYGEIINDAWGDVVNVFRVLRDPESAEQLRRAVELTPFARAEFVADWPGAEVDQIERARRTIFRSLAGFCSASTNGAHNTGFRANAHRSGTTPAHDWNNYPKHIGTFCARLAGVCVEQRPASQIIAQHDRAETLFYVDPPYLHSTRTMKRGNASYAFEMTDDDHRALAEQLRTVRGMVVLSGYPSELYDRELYHDWVRVERRHMADGARARCEVLWMNFQPALPLLAEAGDAKPFPNRSSAPKNETAPVGEDAVTSTETDTYDSHR